MSRGREDAMMRRLGERVAMMVPPGSVPEATHRIVQAALAVVAIELAAIQGDILRLGRAHDD